jgi:phosphoribosylaminoimidazole carboxylase (NCAIR synthetase)
MYRLMKSEKHTLGHQVSGHMSSYRQCEVFQFERFTKALAACDSANNSNQSHHYILNELGQEYYNGTWID